jgi:hypothetical protein
MAEFRVNTDQDQTHISESVSPERITKGGQHDDEGNYEGSVQSPIPSEPVLRIDSHGDPILRHRRVGP